MTKETKICPFCGEEILAIAKKCKHCGEWLKEEQDAPKTIQCPACGEDILSNASTCKHCGEAINREVSTNKFDNLDVDDSWKKRFALVEKLTTNGEFWCRFGQKPNKEFNKMSKEEKEENKSVTRELYFSDIPSILSMFFFGFFYYLVKGMWQKALVYELIYLILYTVFTSLCGMICGILVSWTWWIVLFVAACPFDYYRYKVLGKQW